MKTSNETLRDEKLSLCLSDFIDDTLSSEDLDYLLEQDSKDWESKLNAYALAKSVMENTAPTADVASFDILSGVREGIKGMVPDDAESQTKESAFVKANETIVPFQEQKGTDSSSLDAPANTSLAKSNVITFKLFAMAASVVFVAVLAGQLFLGQELSDYTASSTVAHLDQNSSLLESPQDIKTLSLDVHNERLQSYLRQHTEQATMTIGQGMIPMARVVSFSAEDEQ